MMRSALIDDRVAWVPLLVLVGWTVVGTVLTARTFKWE
jgi:ABC-2 type transport system permease protein